VLVLAARTPLPGDGGHRAARWLSAEDTPLRNLPGVVLAALGSQAFPGLRRPRSG
jgi:hypothetical protein